MINLWCEFQCTTQSNDTAGYEGDSHDSKVKINADRKRIMNRMTFAYLASLAVFAGGLVALRWYKSSRPEYRKQVRKVVEQDVKEAVAEQLV